MSSTPHSTSTSPAPYNGYALTRVKRAGGAETVRFEAVLVRDGRPIAHVANGGEGGVNRYSPLEASGWSAIDEFNRYAAAWNTGAELAGIEDGDQLIDRLLTVDQMNRARALPFLLDDQDLWRSGEYARFKGGVPHEQVLAALHSLEYAHRNPRAWSRMHGDFVPVEG